MSKIRALAASHHRGTAPSAPAAKWRGMKMYAGVAAGFVGVLLLFGTVAAMLSQSLHHYAHHTEMAVMPLTAEIAAHDMEWAAETDDVQFQQAADGAHDAAVPGYQAEIGGGLPTAARLPEAESRSNLILDGQAAPYTVQSYEIVIIAEDFDRTVSLIGTLPGHNTHADVWHGDRRGADFAAFTRQVLVAQYSLTREILRNAGTIEREQARQWCIENDVADTRARLNARTIERERLLDLLSQADRVETMIAIERHLSMVDDQRDRIMATSLSQINSIQYPTLHITIRADDAGMPTLAEPRSLGQRMQGAFVSGLHVTARAFEGLLVAASALALPAVILGGIALLIVLLVRKRGRKNDK